MGVLIWIFGDYIYMSLLMLNDYPCYHLCDFDGIGILVLSVRGWLMVWLICCLGDHCSSFGCVDVGWLVDAR